MRLEGLGPTLNPKPSTPNGCSGVSVKGPWTSRTLSFCLKVHGTYKPIITVLITLLIIPLKGLIGVIPIISRVISPVIIG